MSVTPAPSVTICCRDYRAHQLEHRLLEGRWTCPPCEASRIPPVNPADPLEFAVREDEVQAARVVRQWRAARRAGLL